MNVSEETIRTWLNEFLCLFGWDVQNTHEVLQERCLRGVAGERLREIRSPHRKPDYILVNGTNIKTFLDAKAPTVDIINDPQAAYQIRSYGWSAQVPCAFVSNFESFVIFDTRMSPTPDMPANYGAKYIPIDSTNANTTVNIFVYLFIFFLPTSPPSFVNLSNEGIIKVSNCITIEAVIYGLIDIANTENLEKAPPEIISINPASPSLFPIAAFSATLSTPGTVI